MRIDKPGGGTPTERLLSTLCEKTFLKLWSGPNPRKDDGKELCDLIAIFDNHVFSPIIHKIVVAHGAEERADEETPRRGLRMRSSVAESTVRMNTAHGFVQWRLVRPGVSRLVPDLVTVASPT